MSTKQKMIAALIAVVCIIGVGVFWNFNSTGTKGAKEIAITVETPKETKEFQFHTDKETLSELLKEQTELEAVIEDSTYGAYLTSMLGQAQQDKGPWWLFSSANNQDCKTAQEGMCPAMDAVHIQDGDAFTFTLTSDIF